MGKMGEMGIMRISVISWISGHPKKKLEKLVKTFLFGLLLSLHFVFQIGTPHRGFGGGGAVILGIWSSLAVLHD